MINGIKLIKWKSKHFHHQNIHLKIHDIEQKKIFPSIGLVYQKHNSLISKSIKKWEEKVNIHLNSY